MPIFSICTNIPKEKVPADFFASTTALLSKILSKPDQYCLVHINAGQDLALGGSSDPCGFAKLTSVGSLGKEKNKSHCSVLSKHVQDKLGIPQDRHTARMPIFTLSTNVAKIPAGFLLRTTKLLAQLTNKPEGAMMCLARAGENMTYGGSEAPCAFVTLSSIGIINPTNNKVYSAALCDHVSKELQVQMDRIVIKFQNLEGSNVGWNGITRE